MKPNNFTYLNIFKELLNNTQCNTIATMNIFVHLLESYSFFEYREFYYSKLIEPDDKTNSSYGSKRTIQESLKKLAISNFIDFSNVEKFKNNSIYNKVDPENTTIQYSKVYIKININLLLGNLPIFYHFFVYEFYLNKKDLIKLRELYEDINTYTTRTFIGIPDRKEIFESILARIAYGFYNDFVSYLSGDEKTLKELLDNKRITYHKFKEQLTKYRTFLGIKVSHGGNVDIEKFLKTSEISPEKIYDEIYNLITDETSYNRLFEEIRRIEEGLYS